jgi:pimeloyl-ACP methyl ester carboxylesterase
MSGVATSRDGIPLAFEVHGVGTPSLVFVHGWSCHRGCWRGQVGPLAGRYQTVAVDLAGHGESGVGRRAWTMAAFGEDIVAVVEQLGLGEVVLIGHSMGGDVDEGQAAQQALAAEPDPFQHPLLGQDFPRR